MHYIERLKKELETEKQGHSENEKASNFHYQEIAEDLENARRKIEALTNQLESVDSQIKEKLKAKDAEISLKTAELEKALQIIASLKAECNTIRKSQAEISSDIILQEKTNQKAEAMSKNMRTTPKGQEVSAAPINKGTLTEKPDGNIKRVLKHDAGVRPSTKMHPVKMKRTDGKTDNISNMENERRNIEKGDALFSKGNYIGALECYESVIAINPSNIDVLLKAGITYNNIGKHMNAIECFGTVLDIESNNKRALMGNGEAHYHMGKYQESVIFFDKLLLLEKRNEIAWIGKGNSLYNLFFFDASEKCFMNVLKLNPNSIDGMIGLGYVYFSQNRTEESLKFARKILRLDPRNSLAKKLLEELTTDAIKVN
jgi:tetratricopeptide (TPR) repeat protein